MRFHLLVFLIALFFGQVAVADWAENLATLPPAGTNQPTTISMRNGGEYYFFIPAESTTDSSWITLPAKQTVNITYNSDTTSATMGAGTGTVQVMWIAGTTIDRPAGVTDSTHQVVLLGATLDGVCAASGTPNCSINTLIGPGHLKINISAATAAGDTSLVSMIVQP